MKNFPRFPLILVLFFTLNLAQAEDLKSCDEAYARNEQLFKVTACYEKLLHEQSTLPELNKKQIYERLFITLSAVVIRNPKTDLERSAIEKAQVLLEKFSKEYSGTADSYYWYAVWLSFQVKMQDRGAMIPRRTFAAISKIQNALSQAIQLDPTLHLYGPSRVYGIMHTQMPGIAGGDKVLAEKLLRDAYEHAQSLSANHLAYAKILNINGKTELAIQVLEKFIYLKDSELNPYPTEPLRAPRFETLSDLTEAKNLLQEWKEGAQGN